MRVSRRLFEISETLETVASTNEHLKQFVGEGRWRTVLAHEQTGGRGRYGRTWYSPKGEGLYFSALFFPGWRSDYAQDLNAVSSLAVVRALESVCGVKAVIRLKPPNDVLLNGKKVCGILTELGTQGEQMTWVIVGIGVNILQDPFPSDLEEKATSLIREGVGPVNPQNLAEKITDHLLDLLKSFELRGRQAIQQEYQSRTI